MAMPSLSVFNMPAQAALRTTDPRFWCLANMKNRVRSFLLLVALTFSGSALNAEELDASVKTDDPYVNAVYDLANDILSNYVRMKVCSKNLPEFEQKREAAYRIYQKNNLATLELFLGHHKIARTLHSGGDPEKYALITKYYSDRLESIRDKLANEFLSEDRSQAINHCRALYAYLNSTDHLLASKYAKQIAIIETSSITVMPPKPDEGPASD